MAKALLRLSSAQARRLGQPTSRITKPRLSESSVAKTIKDFLLAEGWTVLRLQSGLFQRPGSKDRITIGEKGLPDYVCMREDSYFDTTAKLFFLETKATNGKVRPSQEEWMKNAKRRGLKSVVAYSFDQFKEWYANHCL